MDKQEKQPNPEKGRASKLWKHLLKLVELVIPVLLPLLLGGKNTGKRNSKPWQRKGRKGN